MHHNTQTTPLPSPQVITTTHTPHGASTIASNAPAAPFSPFGPHGSRFHTFHSTPSVPASNNTVSLPSSAGAPTLPRAPPVGAVFCTTDIPPGGATPMHRTLSLDYCAVLEGEVTLVVEEEGKGIGKEVKVGTGGVIVQRGGMHAWRNDGVAWVRVLVVMVGSQGVEVEEEGEGGVKKVLGGFFPKRPGQ